MVPRDFTWVSDHFSFTSVTVDRLIILPRTHFRSCPDEPWVQKGDGWRFLCIQKTLVLGDLLLEFPLLLPF